jgi:hypothetical protein
MMKGFPIEGEPPVVPDWFQSTQVRLLEMWARTGHVGDGRPNRWACEIYDHCRTCQEHLSLPCSLASEAEEIGFLLKATCFTDNPIAYIRLFLVLLSEFTDGLRNVAGLLRLQIGKPPRNVGLWCNNVAKHRLNLLVQHHPLYAFADSYGDAWEDFQPKLATTCIVDRCGNRRPLMVIDEDWLAAQKNTVDLVLANDERQALVVVPPLAEFLSSTMDYFRRFVDVCLKEPEIVKRFESEHFHVGCF